MSSWSRGGAAICDFLPAHPHRRRRPSERNSPVTNGLPANRKTIVRRSHFKSAFDTKTGAHVRTGVLDENGKDTGVDPFMASYPHLIDAGIMGHCIHGKTGLCAKAGIGCYQSGLLVEQPNMSVDDFRWIAEQSKGKCNQFALGGRGDPDQHEHFEEILKICRENVLVPNFTTSGYGMTPEIAKLCKQYCGAVAVSWYRSEYTLNAIQMLLDAGVKTNMRWCTTCTVFS